MAERRRFTIEEMRAAAKRADQAADILYAEHQRRWRTLEAWKPADADGANSFLKGIAFAAQVFSGDKPTTTILNVGTTFTYELDLNPENKDGFIPVREAHQRVDYRDRDSISYEERRLIE